MSEVSLVEGRRKIRKSPFNFAILTSMALNFFRYNEFPNIKEQRYAFSLNWTKLYDYPHLI